MYGKEPIYDIIRQNRSFSAVELLDTMLGALARFQDGARIDDDITMVVIKVTN
jgi:serine phosphatase RsbU (regulator of sigma subunit)